MNDRKSLDTQSDELPKQMQDAFLQLQECYFKVQVLAEKAIRLADASTSLPISSLSFPIWIDLKRACWMKGVNYNSIKSQWWKKPCGGKPDKVINGRSHWSQQSIKKWLEVGDEELRDYLRQFEIALPIANQKNPKKTKPAGIRETRSNDGMD
jgi:hypothetical protein